MDPYPHGTKIFHNFYECKLCEERWDDYWTCACNDKCQVCGKEIEPYETVVEPVIIKLPFYGIVIELNQVDPNDDEKFIGGTVRSEMKSQYDPQNMTVAIDVLEGFILAAACSGVRVQSPQFIEAIKTMTDKIANEYGV
jgi:hypothetical protein